MICLAIDTAGSKCSACLYDSDRDSVLAQISEEIGKGHAERLMGVIADVMKNAAVSYPQIGKVITTIGPGSFTGIRVGVATARGFGLGLGIPVIGVTNLEALIHMAADKQPANKGEMLVAVMDAGRGQVYCQTSMDTEFGAANIPFAASKSELVASLSEMDRPMVFTGSAAVEILRLIAHPSHSGVDQSSQDIATVARIGAKRSEESGKPEPLYLRKLDALPQIGFAVERA